MACRASQVPFHDSMGHQTHPLPDTVVRFPTWDSFLIAWQSKHQYHKPGYTLTVPAVQASLFPLCGAGYDFMGPLKLMKPLIFQTG